MTRNLRLNTKENDNDESFLYSKVASFAKIKNLKFRK